MSASKPSPLAVRLALWTVAVACLAWASGRALDPLAVSWRTAVSVNHGDPGMPGHPLARNVLEARLDLSWTGWDGAAYLAGANAPPSRARLSLIDAGGAVEIPLVVDGRSLALGDTGGPLTPDRVAAALDELTVSLSDADRAFFARTVVQQAVLAAGLPHTATVARRADVLASGHPDVALLRGAGGMGTCGPTNGLTAARYALFITLWAGGAWAIRARRDRPRPIERRT